MRLTQRVKGSTGKRSKAGKREDLGGRYFRSSWEANYARYLNWLIAHKQIQSWDFECDTFEFPVKRGSKFYTPDFKVTETNGSFAYHEVKGWMDAKSATKLRRMAKYYPTLRVVLIDSAQYKSIEKTAKGLVSNWE